MSTKRIIGLAIAASALVSTVALAATGTPERVRGLAVLASAHADTSQEAAFLAENQAAMDKMMADMAVKPSGDADRDFRCNDGAASSGGYRHGPGRTAVRS